MFWGIYHFELKKSQFLRVPVIFSGPREPCRVLNHRRSTKVLQIMAYLLRRIPQYETQWLQVIFMLDSVELPSGYD